MTVDVVAPLTLLIIGVLGANQVFNMSSSASYALIGAGTAWGANTLVRRYDCKKHLSIGRAANIVLPLILLLVGILGAHNILNASHAVSYFCIGSGTAWVINSILWQGHIRNRKIF